MSVNDKFVTMSSARYIACLCVGEGLTVDTLVEDDDVVRVSEYDSIAVFQYLL